MCLLRYSLCTSFSGVINFWDVTWFVGNNWCGLSYSSTWNSTKISIRSSWKEAAANIRWRWRFGNGTTWYSSCRNGGKLLFSYTLWRIFWMLKIILMNHKRYWVTSVGSFSLNSSASLLCCTWSYVSLFRNSFIIIWAFLMISGE